MEGEENFTYFSTASIFDSGALYGANFTPRYMRDDPEGRAILELASKNLGLIHEKKLQIIRQVLESQPYRIGIELDKLKVDFVEVRNDGEVVYEVSAPVPMRDWSSFEQLPNGKLVKNWQGRWEVRGDCISLDLRELDNALDAIPSDSLKSALPPWADVWSMWGHELKRNLTPRP